MIAALLVLALQDTSRLTLDDAVGRALGRYPSIAVARAAREGAAADVQQAGAQRLPRVALDVTATRNQLPNLVYPLHSLPTGPASPQPVFDRTLYQGTAFLNWTLFDFGARSARTTAQRALLGAAEGALTAAQQDVVARTATAYLQVLTLRGVLAAQDQRLAALAAEDARTRRMVSEGKAARVESLRAEAALARAQADRSGTAGRLDVAEHELAQLVDLPWAAVAASALQPARLADTSDPAALRTPGGRADLERRARAANPDVLQSLSREQASAAAAAAARATRLPELRLQTGLVDRGAPGEALKAEWQAGLEVAWPLYTGGALSGQIARAEAEARGAAEQRRLTELAAGTAVDRAVAAVLESHARVQALRSAVAQSEAVADIERISLEIGAATQTDYLDALAQLLAARSSLIQARHDEIAAHVELARLTGELSPEWLARNVETDR